MDEKIKKLERELAEWKARAEKAEKEAADLRKEIEELKKQLKDKNVRITELETENLTLKEKVKNLEKKVRTHPHTCAHADATATRPSLFHVVQVGRSLSRAVRRRAQEAAGAGGEAHVQRWRLRRAARPTQEGED